MTDEFYMRRAIELAKKGRGWTNPNPMVGAVIVKNGSIIGEGYHEKCGELHAERHAFSNLTEDAHGASMYVTLEPCCHHGKQPPCTEAIIAHGIKKVYVGSDDPNALVAGTASGCRYRSCHSCNAKRMRCTQSCFFSLYYNKDSLRCNEICDDS